MERQVNIVDGNGKTVAKVKLVNGVAKFISNKPQLWSPSEFTVVGDDAQVLDPSAGHKYLDGLKYVFNGAQGGYRTEEVNV